MRIPTHLRQLVNNLALKSWVDSRDFPIDHYAESVEIYRQRLESRMDGTGGEDADVQKAIVVMLAQEIDLEEALSTHVLNETVHDISDESEWAKICEAAAWSVLQRCERMRRQEGS
jgi:hypothetical protein